MYMYNIQRTLPSAQKVLWEFQDPCLFNNKNLNKTLFKETFSKVKKPHGSILIIIKMSTYNELISNKEELSWAKVTCILSILLF